MAATGLGECACCLRTPLGDWEEHLKVATGESDGMEFGITTAHTAFDTAYGRRWFCSAYQTPQVHLFYCTLIFLLYLISAYCSSQLSQLEIPGWPTHGT
jgi:hypothetical protein